MPFVRLGLRATHAIQVPLIFPKMESGTKLDNFCAELSELPQVESINVRFTNNAIAGYIINISMSGGRKLNAYAEDWIIVTPDGLEIPHRDAVNACFEIDPNPGAVQTVAAAHRFVPATTSKTSEHYHTEDGRFELIQFRGLTQAMEAGIAIEWAHKHANTIQYVIGWSLRSKQFISFNPDYIGVYNDDDGGTDCRDGDFVAFINDKIHVLRRDFVEALFNLIPN